MTGGVLDKPKRCERDEEGNETRAYCNALWGRRVLNGEGSFFDPKCVTRYFISKINKKKAVPMIYIYIGLVSLTTGQGKAAPHLSFHRALLYSVRPLVLHTECDYSSMIR